MLTAMAVRMAQAVSPSKFVAVMLLLNTECRLGSIEIVNVGIATQLKLRGGEEYGKHERGLLVGTGQSFRQVGTLHV